MERRVGTVSRGIRCPIIREGDDLVEIVTQSILDAIPMPKVGDVIEIFCHFYNGSMTIDGIL